MKKKVGKKQDVPFPAWPLQDVLSSRKVSDMFLAVTGKRPRTTVCVDCTNRLCDGNETLCSKGIPNLDGEDTEVYSSQKEKPEPIILSHKQAAVFRSFETEPLSAMI